MSKFVTQSVDQVVTVLVISKPGAVVDLLAANLQEKNIEIVLIDSSTVEESFLESFAQQTFYKICWIVDDTIKGTEQADSTFRFLFPREEPLIVVTSSLSQNKHHKKWEEKRSGDEELVQHLQSFLPQLGVLVALDWLDQPELFVSPLLFVKDLDLYEWKSGGVETQDVVRELAKSISRPHQPGLKLVFEDRLYSHSKLEEWYHRAHPQVQEIVTKNIPTTQQIFVEKERDVLPHQPDNVHVVPHVKPKILNRQQLYEENISRIKHRHNKQRLLRPVPRTQTKKISSPLEKEKDDLKPLEQHLELTIQQMFGTQRHVQRETRLQKKAAKTVVTRKKQKRQKIVMRLVTVGMVFLVIVASLVGSFWWMRNHLFSLIVAQAKTQQLADAPVWRSRSTKALVQALATGVQAYQTIFGHEEMVETAAVLSAVRQMQTIYEQRQQMLMLTEKSVAQVLNKEQGNVFTTLTELSAQQQSLYSALSVVQTQLQSVPTEFLEENEQQAVNDILAEIQTARRQLATIEQVRQLLPAFLGQETRRRVAIVLQDSQELRPSGGTIQGIYLLSFEKGVIIDQQFYQPAELEKQQIGEIQTTPDYEKYFNRKEMTLIDAGWNPDFTVTAGIISNYLDRNLGRKPDVVVTTTTQTLQALLEKAGPIQLEDTQETITDKNIYERLGANAEPEYYRKIFSQLVSRALNDKSQAMKFLEVVADELQKGQTFIVSAQPTENDVLNSLGWAGQVSTPQCPTLLGTEKCDVSTIYQVESNIGINKANAQLQRSIVHSIQLEKEITRHKRIVTYTNQSNTSRWPSGTYRNYLRFYVPNKVVVTGVKLGDVVVDLRTLDRGETASGQFFGFEVDVPIQKTVSVTVEYTEPFTYEPGKAYAFFDQKQAGTSAEPYVLSLIPEGIQAAVIAPKAELRNGRVLFAQPREKHQFVGIKFR
jgi:hypothetical protein